MNSKLTRSPRHRMITNAATRLHRRRGLSRHWLAQGAAPRPQSEIANLKSKIQVRWLPLLTLASVLWLLTSGKAATITGNLQTTSGNPYVTNALIAPLSTPLASGNSLIASTPTNVVAAANGSFSVVLQQGNYLVTIGGLRRDSVLISVPNDPNTYNLNSLITNALTFNYTYSPVYEQRVNKGQTDGYVGLSGTTLSPNGLTASNFSFLGTIGLGTAADHSAALSVNQNSSISVQPGASLTLSGDSSPRAEMFLHGTNAFIRFDEDAGINDSTSGRIWKFNRFNLTSNNVATLGDATNIVNALVTVPIGAIVAWDKSLTGVPALPAGFVECNGQTISDTASPLNGRTIRNLNGNNQFLRGNSTSGGNGGAETHTHTGFTQDAYDLPSFGDGGGAGPVIADPLPQIPFTTDASSSLPPYTDMVWIMRIK